MPTSPLLTLDKISVEFNQREVLKRVSMRLYRNKITTIIGPNGAGKSTLIRVITGLLKQSSGQIIRNENLCIGFVPQKLKLNEALPLKVDRFLKLNPKSTPAGIEKALKLTGAEHLRHANMHTLSGGETQRVLIANAVMKNQTYLFLMNLFKELMLMVSWNCIA